MTRLAELTRTRISRDAENAPTHYVVRPTDDALFNCPFVMASDPGTIGFTDAEVERLRFYLLKGGFLWVDDFWGTPAWTQWSSEIARVLPPDQFPIEDVSLTDPLLNAQYQRAGRAADLQLPVLAPLRRTLDVRTRGRQRHRAPPRSRRQRPHRADDAQHRRGRFVGARGRGPGSSRAPPSGYALGVNVLVHAMTHRAGCRGISNPRPKAQAGSSPGKAGSSHRDLAEDVRHVRRVPTSAVSASMAV